MTTVPGTAARDTQRQQLQTESARARLYGGQGGVKVLFQQTPRSYRAGVHAGDVAESFLVVTMDSDALDATRKGVIVTAMSIGLAALYVWLRYFVLSV